MATITPPFSPPNNPSTPNPIGPAGPPTSILTEDDMRLARDYSATISDVAENAKDVHQSLLEQVNALKDARKETKNLYDLQDQIKKLQQERTELYTRETNLGNKLNGVSAQAKKIIDDGFIARRKADEAQRALTRLTDQYNAGLAAGNLTYQEQAELQARIAVQEQNILDNQQLEKELSEVLKGNYTGALASLNDKEKQLVRNYLETKKETDEIEIQKANGKDVLKLLQDEADVLENQLTTWQKINQRIDNLTNKVKSIKVISDTWDWGSKQFNTLIGGGGIQGLLNMVLEYGKNLTDAAKQLGISVDGVRVLARGYEDTAMRAEKINKSANSAFLTTKNQLAAQQELNAALGTSGLVTEQARVDQVVLTKQMGLQADEAAKIYQLGLLNRVSADQVAKTTAQQVINLKKSTGIQLNLKTVLQDVAKVSAQLSAQYGSNPEKIAAAVVKAKELGLTIEQTAGMAEKLLDFESSIENELKAELLTGKALNLEQARYLALMGDTAGAAKEMRDQIGGLAEYQKLNVIQQKSLAEAIGMGREELAESLKQQELLRGSKFATEQAFQEAIKNADTEQEKAELLAQIKQSDNAEQLTQQYQQISAQEKFNQAIEKLKEMVGSLVDGPLGSMLDGLSNAVSSATTLKGIMYAIGAIMVGNLLRGIASFGIQMAAAIAPTSAVAAASIATASAITLGIGVAAIIAGLIGGVTALNSATGENISVDTATGGGGAGGINTPITPSTRPQEIRLVNIQLQADGSTIQNWTNVGNKTLSTGRQA